jgi:hypothetical protein
VNQAEPEDGGRAADSAGHAVTFEEIVAEWIAEGTVPSWPESAREKAAPPEAAALDIESDIESVTERSAQPTTPPAPEPEEPAADEHDEHFVPPDPPPMPRIGITAAIGLALLGLGVVFLAMPAVLGGHAELGLPLGLVSLALGLGWLVLRSWPASADDDRDDGAVL